ncbi:hypothetical protein BX600DRAFT_307212 [Xylariales sp. PMI_506]|nr:hypothetical protein BX600DRAFT_307212 [Xylariales sp. PMI_506]
MNSEENILAGSLWLSQSVHGELPPLVPALPVGDADWDTSLVSHAVTMAIEPERRHSGWEAVEKKWPPALSQRPTVAAAVNRFAPKDYDQIISKLHPALSLPPPQLELDFRMAVVLNTNVATMAAGDAFKKWTTFIEGAWSGGIGTGVVLSGGQSTTEVSVGESLGAHFESSYKLQTKDEPPAIIECKAQGWRIGSANIMKALQDPEQSRSIDPRQYRHRVTITMRTNDSRYAERVNTEMWVGTCLWRGHEVIYDAYKIR